MVMVRILALLFLPFVCAAIVMQLFTARGYRHWFCFGLETAALLACLDATFL